MLRIDRVGAGQPMKQRPDQYDNANNQAGNEKQLDQERGLGGSTGGSESPGVGGRWAGS